MWGPYMDGTSETGDDRGCKMIFEACYATQGIAFFIVVSVVLRGFKYCLSILTLFCIFDIVFHLL